MCGNPCCRRSTADQALTVVPTGSPMMTRRRLPRRAQVEHDDRQLVVHAEGNRGRVHHLQPLAQDLQVGNLLELRSLGVEHRVGGVDAVDLGALEDHVRLHLHRPQGRRGIGGEVRVAGARGEDHDPALLEMPHRTAADERLGNRAHLDRRRDAGHDADVLERILQRERVDHRGQHPHVVRGRAVHAFGAGRQPAKEVAAADDDGGLDPELLDLADLFRNLRGDRRVDPERLFAHQGLTREFEQNATERGLGHIRLIISETCSAPTCAAQSISACTRPPSVGLRAGECATRHSGHKKRADGAGRLP